MKTSKVCPNCGYISIDGAEFESCPKCEIIIKKHFDKYINEQKHPQAETTSRNQEVRQDIDNIQAPKDIRNSKYCTNCGSNIDQNAEICPKCGVRQPSISSPGDKQRIAAGLFALFLGGIGIHKFYLGKIGSGILYLVFCWTFIPLIVSLIEGITYLTMSDEAFKLKYG